uniref:Pentapeptide repeat-containing protein n=1 Tax=Phenylobacterium glaciei TaxID=2803784 RepID=A0A974P381_9CAUL|nr:pentapeptide repeat-containing protein [Phenylobacterium glaciei]
MRGVLVQKAIERFTQAELVGHVLSHEKFLAGSPGGRRMILPMADLTGLAMPRRNLADADLSGASMRGCDLSGTILDRAMLFGSDLRGSNLAGASLLRADLRGAVLCGADLSGPT